MRVAAGAGSKGSVTASGAGSPGRRPIARRGTARTQDDDQSERHQAALRSA